VRGDLSEVTTEKFSAEKWAGNKWKAKRELRREFDVARGTSCINISDPQ
jgi:hypothetical protein